MKNSHYQSLYWQSLDIASEGEGVTLPLSMQINLLASLLGSAILQKAGEDVYELVDGLRIICKDEENSGDTPNFKQARAIIDQLDLTSIRWLLWAFLIFFNLINQAEKQEIIRINKQRAIDADKEHPKAESIAAAIYQLKQKDFSLEQVLSLLEKIQIQPTLTAHPTETKRHTLLHKQVQISDLLNQLSQPQSNQAFNEKQVALYELICLMLYTESIRHIRPTLEDEVHNGCYYLAGSIWQSVPMIYHDIRYALKLYYDTDIHDLPIITRYRSWIGGDCDGNPFATPKVMNNTLHYHHKKCIANYQQQLVSLWDLLSISEAVTDAPQELLNSIEHDSTKVHSELLAKDAYDHEPFRRKVGYMHAKLQHIENYNSEQFYNDLILIQHSLSSMGLSRVAYHSKLNDLIIQVKTFGFHLAALDIRQHSDVHQQTITEILQQHTDIDYASLNEDEKCSTLNRLLNETSSISYDHNKLTEVAQHCIDNLKVMREYTHSEPKAYGSYVISMTHAVSDMLEALFLLKLTKLDKLSDIAPLFETVDDLQTSHQTLATLFGNTHYQQHLQQRKSFQEIMLGYSDSNKDGGYWTSNWSLHKAIRSLSELCRQQNVDYCFFHGRGGSVGRGGGSINHAIMASPSICHTGKIRFTEQGEVISSHYSLADLTHRHLEKISNAMILTTADVYKKEASDYWQQPKITDICDRLSSDARRHYRELIDHPEFWSWYISTTPIEFISKLPIASRPVSRKSASEVDFEGLRAIPWVFSWIQTRYNIPGWYGVGYALHQLLKDDDSALNILQQCYQHWPFFQELINNTSKELARTHLPIAQLYPQNTRTIHQMIVTGYENACQHINAITQQTHFLDHLPVLKKSIQLRTPYTDVLNLLQIELMQRYHKQPDDKELITQLLMLSVNGISAAMQNTG
ncbi:MAG: phosphoenolpyruvate carboxylase [Coxiellaceae bacterium]|nr:phosphoenolpyruvate carboxylase [Coxiellaceae bacterium]